MDQAFSKLHRAASALNISLSREQLDLLDRYSREVLYWKERLNLTGAATATEITERHLIDSLFAIAEVTFPDGARVVDVGTGAGFPGIVMQIARPDLRVVLVEPSRKKVGFLEHLQQILGLDDLRIEWGRAQDLARRSGMRETFDAAVTRATARLAFAVSLCLPFVVVGGVAVFLKGPKAREEVDEAREVIHEFGGQVEACELRDLPETGLRRAVVVLRKVRVSPERFSKAALGRRRRP